MGVGVVGMEVGVGETGDGGMDGCGVRGGEDCG